MGSRIAEVFKIYSREIAAGFPAVIAIIAVVLLLTLITRFILLRVETVFLKKACDLSRDARECEKRILTVTGVFNRFIYAALWITGGIVLLAETGLNPAPLIGAAGIAGIAVGIGSQTLIRDLLNGFFIILENQIRVGDVANIDGFRGFVEEVNLRTIVLRDLSGTVHVFSNGSIKLLSNLTKEWSGYIFDIGVALKEDADRVMDVLAETAGSLENDGVFGPNIIGPIEVFGLDRITDSSIVIRGRIKTAPHEQMKTGREFMRRIKNAFDKYGIEIPFPHRTIYSGSETDPVQVASD